MPVKKIGMQSTPVPPLHSNPVRDQEVKSEVFRRDMEDIMTPNVENTKRESMYPSRGVPGKHRYNTLPEDGRRSARNSKTITGRRVVGIPRKLK